MHFKSIISVVYQKSILSNRQINPIGLRYVRRRVNKEASSEPAIEIVEEKIDVKSLNIPTAARLALENDPKLNENLTKRQLKFSFDPETILNEATKTSKKLDLSTLDDLSEDASVPKSRISCPGCGARLHCQNRNEEGFISADAFKSLKKKELPYTLCFRCDLLKTKKTLLNLEIDSKFDYEKFVLDRIRSESKSHVILLVDLLDIPNSIYEGWSKLIHKIDSQSEEVYEKKKLNDIDIVIVGNKFDLLPNTGPLFEKSIVECLLHNCSIKGIRGEQVKHVELISAKTGYNVERLITRLFKLWNDEGDVYLLGMANAGKSMLFNKLLSSDYCRSLASEAIVRATTSFWPGTTLNMLKFPINFLTSSKKSIRQKRLFSDAEELDKLETQRRELYEKTKNLKFAQVIGTVGSSFKPHSILDANEIDANVDATYSLDTGTNQIVEGSNYEGENDIKKKRVDEARRIYKPHLFTDSSAWFYDTPGILGSQEILRCFSKKELQIVFPLGLIMPRVFWMVPGESLFVGGLIRIDLLESAKDERVLFSIMASPALPIINPFKTSDAERLYNEYYEEGNVLRVPYKNHPREKPLPPLESKVFEIGCIGNYKSTADIVFNCFGWSAVTSRPETKALVRAWTLGANGLHLRQPSLLPFIVNMRKKWSRTDGSQAFRSVYYKKPKL